MVCPRLQRYEEDRRSSRRDESRWRPGGAERAFRRLPSAWVAVAWLALSASWAEGQAGSSDAATSDPDRTEVRWEDHVGRGRDGRELSGRIGRIRVPENRSKPDGKTIELAFVVYPSSNPNPGPPIFYLAGGPGGPGIGTCETWASGPDFRLLDHADVVALDQRGTGLSRPNLSEMPDFGYRLPLDRVVTRDDVIAAEKRATARMVEHFRRLGVDLDAYNSEESADDVDAVREALGFDKIVVYGSSYGSHLGLAYLRRHPEHVARAVLSRVEGPNHTWKLPSQIQAQMVELHERIAADPALSEAMPDFLGTVRGLLARLEKEPVTVTLDEGGGDPIEVVCGPYDLQRGLTMLLANREGLAQAPMAIHPYTKGDWTTLAKVALRARQGRPFSAMAVMMDCASGATAKRRARIEQERNDPANLLGDAMDGYYIEVCEACGDPDLGDDFRGPLRCEAPVLFISGELDARTPPSNVDEIRRGFLNSTHLLVEDCGHLSFEFRNPDFCRILGRFLEGEEIEDGRIAMPPIRFHPIRD